MIPRWTLADFAEQAAQRRQPWQSGYYAAYSSVYEAIVTDPVLMVVPFDDHVVHRGDGVFETFKYVAGAFYNLEAHLDRLEASAAAIGLRLPVTRARMRAVLRDLVHAADGRDCLLRLVVSRGPGGFGVNPYESPAAQWYVAAIRLVPSFPRLHPEGARVIISAEPAKEGLYARAKTCNYLQNALMKMQAVDAGADFAVCFDRAGHLAEGAAETVGLVTTEGALVFPRLDGILAGTTMLRLETLCREDRSPLRVPAVRYADITRAALATAAEILIVGTTIDVAGVREFDGHPVGAGGPGPVSRHLCALLEADILHGPTRVPLHAEDDAEPAVPGETSP